MKRLVLLAYILLLMPNLAQAWWNDDWGYRKKISIDTQQLQQQGVKPAANGLAVVRLHTGNFGFFMDLAERGNDLRFIAADDKTPLKFYIEKIDTTNEIAIIWVKLPADMANEAEPSLWMYYGNPKAVEASEAKGIFDVAQAVNYHFDADTVLDATAYANQPSAASNTRVEGGAIGDAAAFNGSQTISIAATPVIEMANTVGWTVSAWVKIEQAQTNGVLFQRDGLILSVRGQTPVLNINGKELNSPADLNLSAWHHLAVTGNADGFTYYVDGKAVGVLPLSQPGFQGSISIGAAVDGSRGLIGMVDEIGIAKVARDANGLNFMALMQGQNSTLLTYGEDASPDSEEGEESYLISTLNNVTVDGWVIIGILVVMFVISALVMMSKAIVLSRTVSENKKFEAAFSNLGTSNIANLDHQDEDGQSDFDESPLLLSLTGNHAEFAGSSIYRIYHVGVQEMNKRLVKSVGANAGDQGLSAQALSAVKASMDGVLVRELQKLNSQMVLLTIAISGGPFLGLLGTVVGVMITFAAIAASGEVNVNAIAPGIAAALAATVAGLAVAIPALFGYNYLGSQIKMVTADMHVFVDEFVAKLAEQHS
ncbi:MAG: flagellar motor protein MotA [Methylomonas sp.]|nr:MAG: flagellar motor protein MotA [Methylomonas sp.]